MRVLSLVDCRLRLKRLLALLPSMPELRCLLLGGALLLLTLTLTLILTLTPTLTLTLTPTLTLTLAPTLTLPLPLARRDAPGGGHLEGAAGHHRWRDAQALAVQRIHAEQHGHIVFSLAAACAASHCSRSPPACSGRLSGPKEGSLAA